MLRSLFATALAVATLTVVSVPSSPAEAGDAVRRACVVGIGHNSHLNVREYAYQSARAIRRLYRGDCVTVVGVCEPGGDDWCNVHFANRVDGMAAARYLRFADDYQDNRPRRRDWYTIASCSRKYGPAKRAARNFRGGYVVDTSDADYPNFRNGYYCAVSGPHKRVRAVRKANRLKYRGFASAYAKRAH